MLTLNEFLINTGRPYNAYVKHPNFTSLYVRKGLIRVETDSKSIIYNNVLTIANIVAKRPGKGAFTKLINDELPNKTIFVENVHNEQFRLKLINLGFTQVNKFEGFHYLKVNNETRSTRI